MSLELKLLFEIYSESIKFSLTISLLLKFLYRQVALLIYFIIIILFANASILLATFGCMGLAIWSAKLHQLKIIQNYRTTPYNCRLHVQWIMKITSKILIYIQEINPIIGRLFVVFLMINYPINCFLLMGVLFGNANLLTKLIVLMLCNQQMLMIIIFHFVIAKYNGKLVKCNLRTINIAVIHKNCIVEQINIRLNLFIQAFHTKQQYGLTYWKFGLITFKSYMKVCGKIFFLPKFKIYRKVY